MAANLEQANALIDELRKAVEVLRDINRKQEHTIEVLLHQIDVMYNKEYDC